MPERVVRYILAGDSKGAVRAMRETEVASEKTGKRLDRTGKEAETSFAHIEKGAHRVRGAIGSVIGVAGLGGLAFGIKDAVNAGMKLQVQQSQLRNALKNTGDASSDTIKKITEAAEHSSRHGGFAASEELAGMNQFARETHSATAAIKLNSEAVNVARGTHKSYEEAVKLVAGAQNGAARGLQKWTGIIMPVKTHVQALTALQKKQNPELLKQAQYLDKLATAQEANRKITKGFAGQTAAYSKTAQGSIGNLHNIIEGLSEKIGTVMLPYITKAAQGLSNMVDVAVQKWPEAKVKIDSVIDSVKSIVGWMAKHRDITIALASSIGVLVVGYKAVKTVVMVTKAWSEAQKVLNIEMSLNPIGAVIIGIAALTAGIVYCYLHFKTFRTVVQVVFGFLRSATTTVVGFVKKHWKTLAVVLAGPFAPLVYILEHIKAVIHDIVGQANKVGKIAHTYLGVAAAPGKFLGHLVPHFATGGIVGGPAGNDRVPAMLTRGEGVLTQRAVAAVGGAGGVAALNSGGMLPDIHLTLPIKLVAADSGRTLAEGDTRYVLRMGARR